MRKFLLVLAMASGLLIGVTGPANAYPPDPPSVSTSYSQLAALVVATPLSMTGYSRDLYPHWISQGNNCNTREVVLKRDGSGVTVGTDCYPTSGSWYSVYDSVWVSPASGVDIDHMVPLANSWISGAKNWTTSQRQAFANDLSRGQLIAVSASSNRSKGDQSPATWRPSNTGWWCYYARHWIDVKYDYA
ncbi:MAG: HNH endonuclease family protein, partial [Micromonosporaceae bacterium]